jgi:hypothetical protein
MAAQRYNRRLPPRPADDGARRTSAGIGQVVRIAPAPSIDVAEGLGRIGIDGDCESSGSFSV